MIHFSIGLYTRWFILFKNFRSIALFGYYQNWDKCSFYLCRLVVSIPSLTLGLWYPAKPSSHPKRVNGGTMPWVEWPTWPSTLSHSPIQTCFNLTSKSRSRLNLQSWRPFLSMSLNQRPVLFIQVTVNYLKIHCCQISGQSINFDKFYSPILACLCLKSTSLSSWSPSCGQVASPYLIY